MTTQTAIQAACSYGMEECLIEASGLYALWMKDSTNTRHTNERKLTKFVLVLYFSIISSTYRTDVYCAAIKNGGVREWDFAWQVYLNSTNAQEQTRLG